jgi:Fic family protein
MDFNTRMIDFVYNSNRIDWNTINPDALTPLIVERASQGDPTTPQEIRDHCEAVRLTYALVEKNFRSLEDFILPVHATLTKNLLDPAESGKYRRWGVWVGSDICPRHFLIPQYIQRLNQQMMESCPCRDCGWRIHDEFECIHPFSDGNGRTGRLLLMYWCLRGGMTFPITKYEDRKEYYRQIQTYRRTTFQAIPAPESEVS